MRWHIEAFTESPVFQMVVFNTPTINNAFSNELFITFWGYRFSCLTVLAFSAEGVKGVSSKYKPLQQI